MRTIRHGIVTSALILILATLVAADPEMTIDGKTFDFGFAPQQAQLSHTYWIRSTGTDTLKISKVKPACGCTKAPLASNEVAPGDSTSLELIFSTKSYKTNIRKSARITTNAGEEKTLVSFSALIVTDITVTHPITIVPFAINQSHFDNDDQSAAFVIVNHGERELSISLIEFPGDICEVTMPSHIPPHSSAKGEIVLLDKNTPSFTKSMTIELDDGKQSRFTIPVAHTADSHTSE